MVLSVLSSQLEVKRRLPHVGIGPVLPGNPYLPATLSQFPHLAVPFFEFVKRQDGITIKFGVVWPLEMHPDFSSVSKATFHARMEHDLHIPLCTLHAYPFFFRPAYGVYRGLVSQLFLVVVLAHEVDIRLPHAEHYHSRYEHDKTREQEYDEVLHGRWECTRMLIISLEVY